VRSAKIVLTIFSVLAMAVTLFAATGPLWRATDTASSCPLHSQHSSHPASHKCCQAGNPTAIALPPLHSGFMSVGIVGFPVFTKPPIRQGQASGWLIRDALPDRSLAAPLRI
jgi:hypothetical protein